MVGVILPLQTVWFAGSKTIGVGFTVIANVLDGPTHPLKVGVTVMVAVTGTDPVFAALNAGILPVPEATKPIDVLLFVQK
jgi:hypothetical protein